MNHEESTKQDNRPSMQWYPDDWWAEVSLKLCSMAAQGLWFNMLNIMFMANPRGKLIASGKQIHSKELAKILGQTEIDVERWLRELEENNVYSVGRDGCIYCRRMYRQWKAKKELHDKRAEAGKIGAEKRWRDDDNDEAKMATSTPSPTSSPSSTPKDIIIHNGDKPLVSKKRPNKKIQEIIAYAKQQGFPMQGSIKMNRQYIWNLLRSKDPNDEYFTVDSIKKLIDVAVASRGEPYVTHVNDFKQMYYKWADLWTAVEKKARGSRIG